MKSGVTPYSPLCYFLDLQEVKDSFPREGQMPSPNPPSFPPVPEEVEFSQGSFTNAQGLKLATFAFVARGATPTGIVLLLVSQ